MTTNRYFHSSNSTLVNATALFRLVKILLFAFIDPKFKNHALLINLKVRAQDQKFGLLIIELSLLLTYLINRHVLTFQKLKP